MWGSEKNDLRKKTTKSSWEKVATKYAEIFLPLTIYTDSYEQFFSKVDQGASVLDIGCGPGIIAKYTSENRPDLNYWGIDYSESMISISKDLFPNYHFEVKDALDLDSISEKFDAITIGFCIPYFKEEQLEPFFKSCYSLLHKNGKMYLSFVPSEKNETKELIGSTEDKMYFTYFEKNWLLDLLAILGFDLVDESVIVFDRNGTQEEHIILVLTSKH